MKSFKQFLILISAFLFCIPSIVNAQTMACDPASRVRAFYTWFFAHDGDRSPILENPSLREYVATKTLSRLQDDYRRDTLPERVDYFVKANNYDSRDWAQHIDIGRAIRFDAVIVVPVTFGKRHAHSILVYLGPQDNCWKIIRIDTTWGYD